ncbi:MAG TPA: sorbosone dehydrogenase family protein [Magnetospirillaceae bacterium]|jgi:glucose/arabinose dehydrogenase
MEPAAATDVLTGAAAFDDWHSDAPGVRRLIKPTDLPAPYETQSAVNNARFVERPSGFLPKVPEGFKVNVFADGLSEPRMVRIAPNGDVFLAESFSNRVRVLHPAADGATASSISVFAARLNQPFGIAFYPPGPNPQYIYIAAMDKVVRYRYQSGDTAARGEPEIIVPSLPSAGGHRTRDVVFSPDGKTMYVSVGSGSNIADRMPRREPADIQAFEKERGLGAAWGPEERRADVLAFDPDGKNERTFATGIRNCVSMAIRPGSDDLWCVTNERDGLGDNLPPDYMTQVKSGAFYGWPWYYIGDHEDPRHKGERPDLAGKATIPDVLFQPHSAPLGLAFYTASQFPAAYQGNAFVAFQGSWNRAKRTGSKVVMVPFKDGKPTGEYVDFMTGLIASDTEVMGHPVTVAVGHDGALLVTDEVGGVIWRIAAAP